MRTSWQNTINLFLPQTKFGKWAGGLVVMWPLLTIVGTVIVKLCYPNVEEGNGLIDDIRARPLLAITMLLGIGLGALSFPMSLIAIFKRGERSVLSILATLLELLLLFLLVGEFIIKH